jgi:oxygen-dependent protoporphyrinogen oxidase
VAPLPHLKRNPYTSVRVVNFIFDSPPSALHPAGFGYLIPRPANDYALGPSASTGILGTVFDSSSLNSQDSTHWKEYTKLTMMCGGPWGEDAIPSVETLLDRLFDHLRKPRTDPVEVRVHENKECIPTLRVGHLDRMKELRDVLKSERWGGKLVVVGAGVDGPAVPDCVEAARRAAMDISESR